MLHLWWMFLLTHLTQCLGQSHQAVGRLCDHPLGEHLSSRVGSRAPFSSLKSPRHSRWPPKAVEEERHTSNSCCPCGISRLTVAIWAKLMKSK